MPESGSETHVQGSQTQPPAGPPRLPAGHTGQGGVCFALLLNNAGWWWNFFKSFLLFCFIK